MDRKPDCIRIYTASRRFTEFFLSEYLATNKAVIELETQKGERSPKEVLIVPTIAVPLQNQMNYEASKLPYLQGLRLAHPVCDEYEFEISL